MTGSHDVLPDDARSHGVAVHEGDDRPATFKAWTPGFLLLLVAALGAFAVLLALGTWQVQRLAWKEDLLATIEARRAAAPEPVDAVLATAPGDLDYRPMRAEGSFVVDEALVYSTDRGTVGWQVLQPLRLPDGRALIVNRGFVPEAVIGSADWREPPGPATVTGLARDPLREKPNRFVPENAEGEFYWKDFDAIRAALNLAADETLPVILDAGPTPPGVLPVGGQTIVDLPNNHFGYAVTWYGIAVALVGVVVALTLGRLRRERRSREGALRA